MSMSTSVTPSNSMSRTASHTHSQTPSQSQTYSQSQSASQFIPHPCQNFSVGASNISSFYRGSDVFSVNSTINCNYYFRLQPRDYHFQPFIGISIPASIFSPTAVPVLVSFEATIYGDISLPLSAELMITYTGVCDTYNPIPYTVNIYPVTDFQATCNALYASFLPSTPSYEVLFVFTLPPQPVPANATALDILFMNIQGNTAIFLSPISISRSDSSTYLVDDHPCFFEQFPRSKCVCANCCG